MAYCETVVPDMVGNTSRGLCARSSTEVPFRVASILAVLCARGATYRAVHEKPGKDVDQSEHLRMWMLLARKMA